ncbi:alpha/beta hydrolase-like protein [Bimuria novae-zelandiae CBS 107.79]|uniref:Alpha/beta hydrolase-like protein n=1 Tax=Bimuria novae-zelandiae CBS 107.79 TaxID=1447943 RepID=A0A6A5VSY7_9PLEO|nr:alpha/beta hydrolase-like protein [Bimuria novae-zelandiae CBS 107.79]
MASQSTTRGILYVTMQPKEGLPTAQFHDWYNNEHGPGRLRLSFCRNGFRYRAKDLPPSSSTGTQEQPEWMAIYDIEDMDMLTKDVYTKLRKAPVQSQRERDTMKQIHVDRRFYDSIKGDEWKADDFKVLEEVQNEGEGNAMAAAFFSLKEGKDKEEELSKWYHEEHMALLSKVPGWRRTRRFVTSYLDLQDGREKVYLALHEFAPQNGLGGAEFGQAMSTDWAKKINDSVVKSRVIRVYNLYYTFGPAPRDLQSLTSSDTVPAESTDGATKTYPASSNSNRPAIESFITTPDGVSLPYRLEGSADPNAPLLVLSNSILVEYGIWDDFVSNFLQLTNNKYRVLRYNTRGRTALPSSADKDVTVEKLAGDVVTVMDALRAKTASVVGVSLGGATALCAGLMYPERITAFVGCDTNSFAPESNPKAWGERIAVAEKEGLKSSSTSEPIVGEELAEATTRRWFVKESYEDHGLEKKIASVKEMVKTNSLEGFKDGVKALYQYDFRDKMGAYKGKGAFLVGAGDGVLPKTMKGIADSLGSGVELKVVDKAGHLPMVEQPKEVAEFVAKFLG